MKMNLKKLIKNPYVTAGVGALTAVAAVKLMDKNKNKNSNNTVAAPTLANAPKAVQVSAPYVAGL